MIFKAVSADYKSKIYRIQIFFGLLLEYSSYEKGQVELPEKITTHWQKVANPYILQSSFKSTNNAVYSKIPFYTKYLAKLYTFLSLRSFLFVRLLSHFRFPIFDSTEQAILYFRSLYPKEQQNLCMPRSLFAACASKTFKKEGAIFIGVFLPSRAMHAWIIENGKQTDPFDHIWICYQPVAVMYKR